MTKPITIRYSAVDGYRAKRTYKTMVAARYYAAEMVGENPEFGSSYAVSSDGIGKIEVSGCTLAELFAKPKQAAAGDDNAPVWVCGGQWFATKAAAFKESRGLLAEGIGIRINPDDEFISAYPVEGPYLPSELWDRDEP